MTRAYKTAAPRRTRRLVPFFTLGLVAGLLGGCASFNAGSTGSSVTTAQTAVPTSKKKVAIAPIIGAPSKVSKKLEGNLASEVQKQQVPVALAAADKPDYTVRGYVVAAPAKAGTELSYIWDVMDQAGKRAHRITGKEVVTGPRKQDPWANVNEAVLQGIATKTAAQLAAWVPSEAKASTPTTPGIVSASKPTAPPSNATTPSPAKPTTVARSTPASTGIVQAYVPPIVGAPGDGNTALATAIKRKLKSSGVRLSSTAAGAYAVKGNVALGKPTAGKQSIQIEWRVLDPAGNKVGTVSQKNSVPQGSLNGTWGRTADAAATAAAQGIVKLLPKAKAVN